MRMIEGRIYRGGLIGMWECKCCLNLSRGCMVYHGRATLDVQRPSLRPVHLGLHSLIFQHTLHIYDMWSDV